MGTRHIPVSSLSVLSENLLKDGVLLGAALLTAADSLRSVHAAAAGGVPG